MLYYYSALLLHRSFKNPKYLKSPFIYYQYLAA